MTDVTGYGLVGHLLEMLDASRVNATIFTEQLAILPGAVKWAAKHVVPAGLKTNHAFYKPRLEVGPDVSPELEKICVDAQTSGGLLIAVPPPDAEALLADIQANGALQARIIGEIGSTDLDPRITLR
jgi:selenide,water dikinase